MSQPKRKNYNPQAEASLEAMPGMVRLWRKGTRLPAGTGNLKNSFQAGSRIGGSWLSGLTVAMLGQNVDSEMICQMLL